MKKAKRTCRGLLFVFSSTLVIGLGAMVVLEANSNAVDNYLGTQSTIIETTDDGTLYSAFTPDEKLLNEDGTGNSDAIVDAHKKLGRQMSAEGSVLLKNENNALPLEQNKAKVTLFGNHSSQLIAGAFIGHKASEGQTTKLADALKNDGIEVNPVMTSIFDQICKDKKIAENDYPDQPPYGDVFNGNEATIAEITAKNASFRDSYRDYGDAAIVVLSRASSEGLDYSKDPSLSDPSQGITNPMQLTKDEKALIKEAEDNFDKVVVILNSVSMMEIDELKNDPKVDSILWMGIAGNYGADGVADILSGKVSPSGHLTDVYAKNSLSAPAMMNFGDYSYANPDSDFTRVPTSGKNNKYVVEAEGIYTGYRYYETRYYDLVKGQGNANGKAGSSNGQAWDYKNEISYPFGYGLSYTTFEQTINKAQITGKKGPHEMIITLSVDVTNTGKVPGKSVVQVYGHAPYENGQVEKSAIQLVGFNKTKVLEPGEKQTLTIDVDLQNLASWDSKAKGGNGSYVLDAGKYFLSIGNGAHEALNNVLAAENKTTNDHMTENGDSSKTYEFTLSKKDEDTFNVSKAGVTVKNSLEDSDYNKFKEGTVTYLSRSDWNGTYPIEYKNLEATPEMVKIINGEVYTPETSDEIAPNGTKGELSFAQMKDRPFNDPAWDELLSQLDIDEALNFILNGNRAWQTMDSVGFNGSIITENGPNGVGDRNFKTLSFDNFPKDKDGKPIYPDWKISKDDKNANYGMRTFPSATVVASTFNSELAYQQGRLMGNDALFVGLPILWGPSMNTHRTGYNGRNIEYYSEDPYLTGIMGMEYSIGALDKGLIAAPKHFAFNDQETNRAGVAPYTTEQRAREVELRAFQLAFEATKYDTVEANGTITNDRGLLGVMTSFSKLGPVECTMNKGLLTDILRGEWGYNGYIVSDLNDDYDQLPDCLAAGITSWDTDKKDPAEKGYSYEKFKNDPFLINKIKDSVHHNLYVLSKSNYMNLVNSSSTTKWNLTWWRGCYIGLIGVSAVLAVGFLGANIWLNLFKKDKPEVEEK